MGLSATHKKGSFCKICVCSPWRRKPKHIFETPTC